MTPMQAIKSATSVAAKHMGLDGVVGTLREGMRADIVAVPGNPLTDVKRLRSVSLVIKDGKILKEPDAIR